MAIIQVTNACQLYQARECDFTVQAVLGVASSTSFIPSFKYTQRNSNDYSFVFQTGDLENTHNIRDIYSVLLPIRTAATDVKVMCNYCDIRVVGDDSNPYQITWMHFLISKSGKGTNRIRAKNGELTTSNVTLSLNY